MALVHVCRHGQDLDNEAGILNGHRDQPLTVLGEQQARTLADSIKASGQQYAAIYSSPLRRANMTARAVGDALGLPVVIHDDLIERDFGVLSGKPYADIPKYAGDNTLQTDKVLYFLSCEGAESFDDCYKRAQRVFAFLDEKHSGERVLLVCHGDIGKMLIAARKGVTWREGLLLPYFSNTEVISTG